MADQASIAARLNARLGLKPHATDEAPLGRAQLCPDGGKHVVSAYVRPGQHAPRWVNRDGQHQLVNCVGRVLR